MEGLNRVVQAIRGMGLERPRVALALLPLSLFGIQFLMGALAGESDFRALFVAMAASYLLAFVALASEWFWARWFASGLGWWGALMGLMLAVMVPLPEVRVTFAIFCGMHALIIVMLMGKKMAARYDMQPGWREHFGMDEFGVVRLGRAVTRASAALPGLLLWAFAPRQPNPEPDFLALGAAGLAMLGMWALLRRRTWGIFALGGAGAAMLGLTPPVAHVHSVQSINDGLGMMAAAPGFTGAVALLLFAATLPFAGAAVRYYRSLR
jgi:uncharacterized protein YqgC (DUF456 family)